MDRVIGLIPAYNAAEFVARVVNNARQHVPVTVVNDGSTDATAQQARAAGALVIDQNPNQGKGAALQRGFRWALEQDVSAVITLDADGQHDPAEIPRFRDCYQKAHPDLIIGARDFSQMPFVRRLSNTIGRRAFSWAMGQPVRDNQSGYRLLSRRLMAAVLTSAERGFEFEMEMIVICVRNGWRMEWVPIRTIYADEKSNIRPLQHVANFFRMVWRTRRALRAHGAHSP
ncbi:MAG: glycosyltransferase family 2 protein [Longimicrobiales bacterium]